MIKGLIFCNSMVKALTRKYSVLHRISTPYHPQTNEQIKISNREVKNILEKTINPKRKDWSLYLNNALCAYQTTYKIPIATTPFKLIYGKSYHLSIEIEHKAYWAIKQ